MFSLAELLPRVIRFRNFDTADGIGSTIDLYSASVADGSPAAPNEPEEVPDAWRGPLGCCLGGEEEATSFNSRGCSERVSESTRLSPLEAGEVVTEILWEVEADEEGAVLVLRNDIIPLRIVFSGDGSTFGVDIMSGLSFWFGAGGLEADLASRFHSSDTLFGPCLTDFSQEAEPLEIWRRDNGLLRLNGRLRVNLSALA